MSSTLIMEKSDGRGNVHFKLPVKGYFARKYYGHDGTLGGGYERLSSGDISFVKNLLNGELDCDDRKDLNKVLSWLTKGHDVWMYFEV